MKILSEKLTKKQALSKIPDSCSYLNLIWQNEHFNKFFVKHDDFNIYWFVNLCAADNVKNLGPCVAKFNEYECFPGLWLIQDEEVDVLWAVWSDGWKKNTERGTSYEFVTKLPHDSVEIKDSFVRLIEFLFKENTYKKAY